MTEYGYNLKFQLVKFEKAIAFQIHKQTELWRCKNHFQQELIYQCKRIIYKPKTDGELKIFDLLINIRSHEKSEINCKTEYDSSEDVYYLEEDFYIKGILEDSPILSVTVSNSTDVYYDLIIEALKEWSLYVYKITNREPQEPKELGNGIYEI